MVENNKSHNQISNKLFSIGFLLLVNNFSLVRIGIPANVTLGKVGALLILLILLLKINSIKVSKKNLQFLIGFSVFLCLYLISTLLHLNSDSLSLVIGYLEILFLMISSAFIIKSDFNIMLFIKIMVIGSFLVNTFVFVDIIIHLGLSNLSNPEAVRHYLIFDFQYRALNALMNGLLFMSCFSFSVIFRKAIWKRGIYYICIFNALIFIILAILSGSRQTLVGSGVFLLVFLFMNTSINRINLKRLLKTLGVFFGIYLVLYNAFLLLNVNLFEWIQHRFGNRQIESIEDVDSRVIIANEGLEMFLGGKNILFGYGMDGFFENIGINAHNGFVKILFETGLLGFCFFILYILYYLMVSFSGLRILQRDREKEYFYIGSLMFSVFVTFTFVMNFFKEIFEYHFYWIFFIILIKFCSKEIKLVSESRFNP